MCDIVHLMYTFSSFIYIYIMNTSSLSMSVVVLCECTNSPIKCITSLVTVNLRNHFECSRRYVPGSAGQIQSSTIAHS